MVRNFVKEAVEVMVRHKEESLDTWVNGINDCPWTQEEKDYAIKLVSESYKATS